MTQRISTAAPSTVRYLGLQGAIPTSTRAISPDQLWTKRVRLWAVGAARFYPARLPPKLGHPTPQEGDEAT